ncbi:sugar ABC transporter ATP-binding protein [Natronolimnobius sp. AArcel1]|uniref:ATP-binding cassette domain-containing protein n=1 Tax=Natronolimnobius sp. AArcel1 TaxID=1679093 RepID=UPI0013ED42AB|nr:ATP-binding cassette domain-containing protein [Natronolimnobius sp. AArcel1]NGM70487.1 sugar ABC transporter ATP-binding protein [Natronolimnobius sp. AArcel1]
MSSNSPVIQTQGLTKEFGTIKAVNNVDFSAEEGEIMAIVGDNGAGKSTLIKMLCGVLEPTEGEIFVRGESVSFDDYNDARQMGIGTVYQDLALTHSQTVASNVFLGNEPVREGIAGRLGLVDKERMNREATEALEKVKIPVDPNSQVRNLSGGQQQAVAIARALQFNPDILIMDEPTSALSIEGVRNVLNVVNTLRKEGISIILISHNIEEVLGIADRISVLHQGELMGVLDAKTSDREDIVLKMMGGKESGQAAPLEDIRDDGRSTA